MDQNQAAHVVRNLERLSKETASSHSLIKATLDGHAATAKAVADNADGLVKQLQEMFAAAGSFQKDLRKEQRRYERLADAVRLYVAAHVSGTSKQQKQAHAKVARVLGSGGGPETLNTRNARSALYALARSESWDAITLVNSTEGTMAVASTVVTWKGGGTERHPREAARVALREVFDVDVDAPGGANSFLDLDAWDDEDDD